MDDKLLINLRILGKIQKNGNISRSSDGIIAIENESFYLSIKRFVTSDSRKQSIFEINSIINETIKILESTINSKYLNKTYCNSNEYYKNCVNLTLILNELKLALQGIENLKFTYKQDINTVSQLDILIMKIENTLNDMIHKLSFFKKLLPEPYKSELENTNDKPHYYNETQTHFNEVPIAEVLFDEEDYDNENPIIDMNEI